MRRRRPFFAGCWKDCDVMNEEEVSNELWVGSAETTLRYDGGVWWKRFSRDMNQFGNKLQMIANRWQCQR